MKKILSMASVILMSTLLTGCGDLVDNGESITAVGSSAMQPLAAAAGEEFSSEHVGKFINVQGGGSGTGLSQVQAGAVEIGNSDLFAEEKSGLKTDELVDHKVAVVGITPIVNKEVSLSNLSMTELKNIFTGKITNWSELGGADLPIVLINRANGSGTRHTFEQWVLDGEVSKLAQEQESTGMVRQIVATTPGAISYVAFSYVTDEVKALKVDGVEPLDKHVKTNKWKIWSYEHMYTLGEPKGLTKEYLDYMLSDHIQKEMVPQLGYIPVTEMKVERDAAGNITEINAR